MKEWCKINKKSDAKGYDHKKKKINISGKSWRYTRAQGAFSDKVTPDINYFKNGPLVQYEPVVEKNIFVEMHTDVTNDK